MEIGFLIGLGFWLVMMCVSWTQVTSTTKLDPVKLVMGLVVYVGTPTFIGYVIERFL